MRQNLQKIEITGCPMNMACNIWVEALKIGMKCESGLTWNYLSRDVRKPDICMCENKNADQLRGNCKADQRICFRHTDSTIPLLPKCEISSP